MPRHVLSTILGLVGAAAGGAHGALAFAWLIKRGFYALMIPGFVLGLGCYAMSRHRSKARGVVCGLAAVALGLGCEWHARPFVKDEGLAFFLTHLHHLSIVTWVMIVIGGYLAFSLGRGSVDEYLSDRKKPEPEA